MRRDELTDSCRTPCWRARALLAAVAAAATCLVVGWPASAQAQQTAPRQGLVLGGAQTSANWSGYVVRSPATALTEVSGHWTVPRLDCAQTPNAGVAIWAGLGGAAAQDGVSTSALLQTGVTSACLGEKQTDYAWWERYPNDPNDEVRFIGMAIAPGDHIAASVERDAAGVWTTTIIDVESHALGVMVVGTGWGVERWPGGAITWQGSTTGLGYSGATSAEWIAEDYRQGETPVSLAAFGTVGFSALTTNLRSWRLSPADAVDMVQGSSVVSAPAQPAGRSFSVAYLLDG